MSNTRHHLYTHGMSNTREYRIWGSMVSRCENPSHPDFPRYGARGISVLPAWRDSFLQFLKDVGPSPGHRHVLERYPNPDGNYEPGNVRWVTRLENSSRRRNNVYLTIDGVTKHAGAWVRGRSISAPAFLGRIMQCWTPREALNAPIGHKIPGIRQRKILIRIRLEAGETPEAIAEDVGVYVEAVKEVGKLCFPKARKRREGARPSGRKPTCTGRYQLEMPLELHADLIALASEKNVTLGRLIETLLRNSMKKVRATTPTDPAAKVLEARSANANV